MKSGIINDRQRYKCKQCNYFYTVSKAGKSVDPYFVTKALQLYIEGVSFREIERLLGVSHVSVMNWVRKYRIKAPENKGYHPTYRILSHEELVTYISDNQNTKDSGLIITALGDKYMLIKWEKFKE